MDFVDQSFVELIANRLPQLGAQRVLTFENGGKTPDQTRTYQEIWDKGHQLAWGLSVLGLQAGDRFALLIANHAEFVDAMMAAAIIGAVFVPIDPRVKGEKLIYALKYAGCKGVIAAPYSLDNLQQVRDNIGGLEWVLVLDDESLAQESGKKVIPYREVLARVGREHPLAPLTYDTPMQLIFTSGTTGDPKGIVMSQGRYCQTARVTRDAFAYQDDEVLYTGLSLTHANAQLVTLGATLTFGFNCVISRNFTKSRLWDITRRYGCTTFSLLGGMTTALYAEPAKELDAYNPVRHVVSAGMPAAIWTRFEERFGVRILEFYGAAEGGITVKPIGVGPVGSIGKPIPSQKCRIVDEQGNDCPPGTPGELWIRPADDSPFIVEYFDFPEASAKKCAGGWLHMGDVVEADQDGWLYFRHRMGSGIRCNGEFINPAVIEKLLAEQPDVDDAFVYGLTDPAGAPGEKQVVAAIVPTDPTTFNPQKIFALCRSSLESSHVPRLVQVLGQIPKTASEKPQERFLLEALSSDPGSTHREQRSRKSAAR
jgi:crotonobetaine/carnitine-CoA ligase